MKICKDCQEPKFNFQMYKFSYSLDGIPFSSNSKRLKICKKCFKSKVFELAKKIYHDEKNNNNI